MKTPKLAYVVEDDRITAAITGLIAKKNLRCRTVKTFDNGQLAFDQLTATLQAGGDVPDLILLDLNMPLMDGWEFLDALSSLPLARPMCVFVLTSSIHPDDMAKATHYDQVKGYFSKPLDKPNVSRMQGLLQEVGGYQYQAR
ncbi:MAG: response regulator [Hymenobacter sp.]|nr:MAG: response regulator [Hymenobacter sp.]